MEQNKTVEAGFRPWLEPFSAKLLYNLLDGSLFDQQSSLRSHDHVINLKYLGSNLVLSVLDTTRNKLLSVSDGHLQAHNLPGNTLEW